MKNLVEKGMAALGLCLALACGGGSSDSTVALSPSTIQSGVFLDSAVEGLSYQTATLSGNTDVLGTFKYDAGETVTFSVSGITLGQAQGASLLTVIDLVSAAKDESNSQVVQMARFLQTLDDDQNPENGIKITAETRSALSSNMLVNSDLKNISFSDNNLFNAALLAVSAITKNAPVSAVDAQKHLRSTFIAKITGGQYQGQYFAANGNVMGSWTAVVQGTGNVLGTATPLNQNAFDTEGVLVNDSSTYARFGSIAHDITFSGNFLDGKIDGLWSSTTGSGNFSGNKQL